MLLIAKPMQSALPFMPARRNLATAVTLVSHSTARKAHVEFVPRNEWVGLVPNNHAASGMRDSTTMWEMYSVRRFQG